MIRGTSLGASDISAFLLRLSEIGGKVGRRSGTNHRSKDDRELFCFRRYAATLALHGEWLFPCSVTMGERPDFMIAIGENTRGLEVTEATTKSFQRYDLSYAGCGIAIRAANAPCRPMNTNETALHGAYEHGRQTCRACFERRDVAWNAIERREFRVGTDKWQLRANPGYWGSSMPEILVCGFSKGPGQNTLIDEGRRFESVPFNDGRNIMRPNLKRLLCAVGLMSKETAIEQMFEKTERRFGFASLIRCSVQVWDGGDWKGADGNILGRTLRSKPAFVSTCAKLHLRDALPSSVKLIVMLGANRTYVPEVMRVLDGKSLGVTSADLYAYRTPNSTVVHLPHPSGGNNGSIAAFCGDRPPKESERAMLACRQQVGLAISSVFGT